MPSFRPRVSTCLFIAGLGLAVPRGAGALSIDKLSIRISRRTHDEFRLGGRLAGITLEGVDSIALAVDRFSFEVPVSAGRLRRHKFAYRGKRGAAGLTTFRLDVASGRFEARGRGLALAGLPNPLPVRLATARADECAMLSLRTTQKRARRTIRLRLARDRANTGACGLGVPTLDPANIAVGQATNVRVRVTVVPTLSVDGASVALYRMSESGRPAGSPLCTLRDDGNGAQGDDAASDGVFSCVTSLQESTAHTMALRAQATAGGLRLVSPGATLGVVPPLTDADAYTIVEVQAKALEQWKLQLARLGDTIAARVATVQSLATLDGVADVMLGGDGSSLEIHFTSGVTGGLILTPRTLPAGTPAALGHGGAFVARPGFLEDAVPSAAARAPATSDRPRVGNARALVFDPGYFANSDTGGGSVILTNEAPLIAGMLQRSSCPKFTVTQRLDRDASVAALADVAQYGTVALSTHGFFAARGDVGFLTGDRINEDFVKKYAKDLQLTNVLATTGLPERDLANLVVVRPPFVSGVGGSFDKAIIYAGSCWSSYNRTLADAFLGKGAAAFFGYTRAVSTQFATMAGRQLFSGLLAGHKSAVDAWAAVSPLIDPYDSRHAVFTPLFGSPGVAYLGDVKLTPEQSDLESNDTATLTGELPGGDDCDLRYVWTNTAKAGHVDDGEPGHQDSFESTSRTVTYTADADATDTDTVSVEVVALGSDGSRDSIGKASAEVKVKSTRYTISGANGGNFVVDDGLDVYLNNMLIHSDGGASSGSRAPFSFTAKLGDTLRFVVNDTFGGCSSLTPLYIANGGHRVLIDGGFDLGCPGTPSGGVTHNYTTTIPF
jgi:hypothetical protein